MNDLSQENTRLEEPRPRAGRLLLLLGGLVVLSVLGLVVLTLVRHGREGREGEELAGAAERGPHVYVATAKVTPGERVVILPADVRALNQATIFAKTTGYLRNIRVDKGDRVKNNQVLGIIESPETDQQVSAAESDLSIKTRDAERARKLGPAGVMSAQDVDRAEADLKASQANLARMKALQAYEVLKAPFDGVVTARYVDMGALLQGATPVIDVADPTHLRIGVYVGQDVASFLKVGDRAVVWTDEQSNQKIEATVTRLSSALDLRSRAMLCEVWLDNAKYNIYPGTYVHVALHVKVPPLPTVPADALFTRGDKTYVAVVRGDVAHLTPVEPGLNDGKTAQILTGLQGEEAVALNFPSELEDGAHVQARPMKQPSSPPGAPPAAPPAPAPRSAEKLGPTDPHPKAE